jgi:ABC-type multidrug transport system fused ATPase/permease subunit
MIPLNSRQYNSLINLRTLVTICVALASCLVVFVFKIRLHQHMMLFSIIITFPLVFTLQSAFKRRDRALEFLSLYKAAMAVVYQSIARAKKLGPERREEARTIMTDATQCMMDCLSKDNRSIREVFHGFDRIFRFLELHKAELGGSASTRAIRYMRDVYEAGSYLISLKRHRTIQVLRAFSFIAINLFPFIQAAILYDSLGDYYSPWVIYAASALTAIVLITMYNIQLQLEYPFDQVGKDDIHLEDFMFDPGEWPQRECNEVEAEKIKYKPIKAGPEDLDDEE